MCPSVPDGSPYQPNLTPQQPQKPTTTTKGGDASGGSSSGGGANGHGHGGPVDLAMRAAVRAKLYALEPRVRTLVVFPPLPAEEGGSGSGGSSPASLLQQQQEAEAGGDDGDDDAWAWDSPKRVEAILARLRDPSAFAPEGAGAAGGAEGAGGLPPMVEAAPAVEKAAADVVSKVRRFVFVFCV